LIWEAGILFLIILHKSLGAEFFKTLSLLKYNVCWGSHTQILVDASIRSSPLWSEFTIHHLHRRRHNARDLLFADFVDAIGDGTGPDVFLDMLSIITDSEDIIQLCIPQSHTMRLSILPQSHNPCANQQVDHYDN
jgi:hypothetical protein